MTDRPAEPFHDLDGYVALPRLAGLALSPDGARLVTSVASLNPERTKWVSSLWEIDPTGRRQPSRLTRSAAGEGNAEFLPDGTLLFTSSRPDPDQPKSDDKPVGSLWALPAGGRRSAPDRLPSRRDHGTAGRPGQRHRRLRGVLAGRRADPGDRDRTALGPQGGRGHRDPVRGLSGPALGPRPRPGPRPDLRPGRRGGAAQRADSRPGRRPRGARHHPGAAGGPERRGLRAQPRRGLGGRGAGRPGRGRLPTATRRRHRRPDRGTAHRRRLRRPPLQRSEVLPGRVRTGLHPPAPEQLERTGRLHAVARGPGRRERRLGPHADVRAVAGRPGLGSGRVRGVLPLRRGRSPSRVPRRADRGRDPADPEGKLQWTCACTPTGGSCSLCAALSTRPCTLSRWTARPPIRIPSRYPTPHRFPSRRAA